MSRSDAEFLRDFYQALEDRPLAWDDRRRINLYEHELAEVDPAAKLERRIEFSAMESAQLFSGFRGTGKSTELRRLAHRLRESGAIVVFVDMREYLNLEVPLDIGSFLLTIAGAFGECLTTDDTLGWDPVKEGYWTRFKNFVTRTQIDMSGLDIDGTGLKTNLRNDPSFRERVKSQLEGRVGTLLVDVREFFADCVRRLRARHGDAKIVLLLDSLEHLSVTSQTHHELASAIERVFTLHADKLRLPDIHAVYTVPPWLEIRSPGIAGLYDGADLIPCVKVRELGGAVFRPGVEALIRVVTARDGEWQRMLAPEALERIVLMSGGYMRDLFRLLREAVIAAADSQLPLSDAKVTLAIELVRDSYKLTIEDALWLARVAKTHETELRNDDGLPDLSRYFDTHLLLCYRNGAEWYDVHPLIAERVERIVERERERQGQA